MWYYGGMKKPTVTAVGVSMSWRDFLPRCLHPGDTMDELVSILTPEEWDRRWFAYDEHMAPHLVAWSKRWVYYSFYDDHYKLRVYRVPRHPETLDEI